jgi:hypothetical protein
MRFRRRARRPPEPGDARAADDPGRVDPADAAGQATDERPPSITGTYLTDGESLFRVQHAITEADGLHLDEALLELEDCRTLELILCSEGALKRLGLRPINPAQDPSAAQPAQRAGDAIARFARSR